MIEIHHTEPKTAALRKGYDNYYQHRTTEHARSYYRWALRHIRPRPGSRLLDVCCGTAKLVEEARSLGVDGVGVDFSIAAVRQSSSHTGVADAMALPFGDNLFDYVVNLGSLEHLENMALGVSEMARVLKPGGVCCVLVPNLFGLLWTVRHARHWGELYDDDQPLQRYATIGYWRRLLESNGMRVVRVIGFELPPPKTLAQWIAFLRDPWFSLLPFIVWRFVPINISSMPVFFCHKA
jgi:SAM-dependent methyltransferase